MACVNKKLRVAKNKDMIHAKRKIINNMQREEIKVKILQINLNRCRLAHDLMIQVAHEQKIIIVLISELLKPESDWTVDKLGKVAIWITRINGVVNNDQDLILGDGFVGTKVEGMTFISTYILSNIKIEKYIEVLETIREEVKQYNRVFISGDFNARSAAWGSD